jgi:hypothetical protein
MPGFYPPVGSRRKGEREKGRRGTLFGDVDGRDPGGSFEKCGNEVKKEPKVCEKSVPNWIRCVAKSPVQLS